MNLLLKMHGNCVNLDKYKRLEEKYFKLCHDYETLKFDYLKLKSKTI